MYDFAIIGGGIIGLSTAFRLQQRKPGARIVLLEKETVWAAHQTSRNSGVIHSGIYYKPGSLKARLAKDGNRSMMAFCEQHGVRYDTCGKLIVATKPEELPQLHKLHERGRANGLDLTLISAPRAREIEPKVRCLAAIQVLSTGIVNYRDVCQALVKIIEANGADLRLGTQGKKILQGSGSLVIETNRGSFETRFLINCAGLHSDRIARLEGSRTKAKIVPFRGEYYELRSERRDLVRNLIYPVPNPAFPFLGVHFTRMMDGSVHAGPNAVLSLKREGYRNLSFHSKDALETLSFMGFWKLAARYRKEGLQEIARSLSKKLFLRSLQELVPDVQSDDLVASSSGVRAQALLPTGELVDDFLFQRSERALHVCNAPSPAATASLEIASHVVDQVLVS